MQTVLIATDRRGKQKLLAGSDVPYAKQVAEMQDLFTAGSNEYASVGLFYLEPCKPVLQLPRKQQSAK